MSQRGEALDRFSILLLKMLHAPEDQQAIYALQAKRYTDIPLLVDLLLVNSRIWKLEADIRNRKDKKLGLTEIGRRAIAIRELNDQRVAFTNQLNDFKEVKINASSE